MTGRAAGWSRAARLSGKAAFDRVFAARQRLAGRYLRIGFADNELGHARLGMAVSRRVSKHAVVRNRLRRQIRESFRRAWPMLPALDIVVTALGDAAQAEREAIWSELARLWQRLAR